MSKINETNYPRRTQANYADTDMLVIQAAGGNTYTTRLEDMREDYEETLAPTLSALQDDVNENLATIEAGSTASQAYAKGDFLVFGGRLCKAKTSIAVNATLVLDTNIELASVGGELSSISSDLASKAHIEIFHIDNVGASTWAYTNLTTYGITPNQIISVKPYDGVTDGVYNVHECCLNDKIVFEWWTNPTTNQLVMRNVNGGVAIGAAVTALIV